MKKIELRSVWTVESILSKN